MNELPLDASDKRLHKMYLMAEYCASFSGGCSETQMIKYAKGFGNIVPTIMKLLSDMGENGIGLVTRLGNIYYVTDTNYISWGEAKGFRERTYLTKCKECGSMYDSKKPECPGCHAESHILNNPGGGIHTQLVPHSITEIENPDKLTTNLNTHTHKNADIDESIPRSERVLEGRKAEKRVVNLLRIFGTALLGNGRGGEPDVFFNSHKAKYCVEVKSVENQKRGSKDGYKVGVVSLSRGQWVSLCSFGEANGMEPLMIVEVKIRGAQNLYHFIKRDQIDHKVYSTDAKHIRISVHDLPIMSVHSYREGVPLVGAFQL